MSTPISVVGTIATVPRLIRTASGVPLCSFRLASSERRYDRERSEWVDGVTNWYSVTAFRSLAEHSHYSFQKGDRVFASGRLRVRNWENKERSGTSVEIEADALGHELRWGTTRFARQSVRAAGESSLPPPGVPANDDGPSAIADASRSDTDGGVNDTDAVVNDTDEVGGGPDAVVGGAGSERSAERSAEESATAAWTVPGAGVPESRLGFGNAVADLPTAAESEAELESDDGSGEEELPLAS